MREILKDFSEPTLIEDLAHYCYLKYQESACNTLLDSRLQIIFFKGDK